MKTYYITSGVKTVFGWQQWKVQAESEEEAARLFRSGDVEFVAEDIEVQDIDTDNIVIEELDDLDILDLSIIENLNSEEECSDKHVKAVTEMMIERSRVGMRKYGVNLEREDFTVLDWLQHLQEELCDAANYVEVLKEKERNRIEK